ncbi:MAG: hypothetical protein WC956_02945 [bacterium]
MLAAGQTAPVGSNSNSAPIPQAPDAGSDARLDLELLNQIIKSKSIVGQDVSTPEKKAEAFVRLFNANPKVDLEIKLNILENTFGTKIPLPPEKMLETYVSVINADNGTEIARKVALLGEKLGMKLSLRGDAGSEHWVVDTRNRVFAHVNHENRALDVNTPYVGEIASPCVGSSPLDLASAIMPVPLEKGEATEFRKLGSPEFDRSSFHLCTNTPVDGIYGYPYQDGARNMRVLKAMGDCSFLKENLKERCDGITELINTYPPPPKQENMGFWSLTTHGHAFLGAFYFLVVMGGGGAAGAYFAKKYFNGRGPKGPGDGGASAIGDGLMALGAAMMAQNAVLAELAKNSVKPQQPEGADKPAEEAAAEKGAEVTADTANKVAQVSTFAALLGGAAWFLSKAATVAQGTAALAFCFMDRKMMDPNARNEL